MAQQFKVNAKTWVVVQYCNECSEEHVFLSRRRHGKWTVHEFAEDDEFGKFRSHREAVAEIEAVAAEPPDAEDEEPSTSSGLSLVRGGRD